MSAKTLHVNHVYLHDMALLSANLHARSTPRSPCTPQSPWAMSWLALALSCPWWRCAFASTFASTSTGSCTHSVGMTPKWARMCAQCATHMAIKKATILSTNSATRSAHARRLFSTCGSFTRQSVRSNQPPQVVIDWECAHLIIVELKVLDASVPRPVVKNLICIAIELNR